MGGVRVDVNKELKFCENSKEKKMGGGGRVRGGQGGCERRIKVFVKIFGGGGQVGGGGRVGGVGGLGWM